MIGLYSPREQSGKSTVTAYLDQTAVAAAGKTMVNIKISAPLKQPLYDLGLTEEEVEGKLKEVPNAKLGGKSPREVMIAAYKAGAAKDGPDWLAKLAAHRILDAVMAGYVVVVDDVRTPADYEMIRRFTGAVVWRVFRPKTGGADIGKAENIEGMLEGKTFDLKVDNVGTLQDLYGIIDGYFAGK
ncbi:MAG: hypothetical protein GC134_05630 [Proteobacteria bacterium]|nr:hypothetical protein [Pseudomonadota bacterium]